MFQSARHQKTRKQPFKAEPPIPVGIAGKVMAADVAGIDEAKPVNGKMIDIELEGSTVKVNDAAITATDIAASNGVIHVIDMVIIPPEG